MSLAHNPMPEEAPDNPATALLDRNPNPTDAELRQGMNGVICRCMTYYRIQAAVRRAAEAMAGDRSGSGDAGREVNL